MAYALKNTMKRYKSWRNGNFTPSNVELLVSSRCNLRCIMCNVWRLAEKDQLIAHEELEISEYKNLLDELSQLGTKSVCISGGEPLLKKGVFSIIHKAKEKGLFVELITNGTLITSEIAQRVIESGVDLVTISIDAPRAEVHDQVRGASGSWEKSTRGLRTLSNLRKRLNSQKPKLAVDYVVTKINCRFIPEMIDLKPRLGFDEIHLLPIIGRTSVAKELFLGMDDLRWLKENLKSIKHKMKLQNLPTSKLTPISSICNDMQSAVKGRYKILDVNLSEKTGREILCFAPWVQATIDPFGNVYPCCYACTFQNSSEDLTRTCWGDEDFPMGNLKEESFEQIWHGDRFRTFREKCHDPAGRFAMCRYCGYDFSQSAVMTGMLSRRRFFLRHIHKYAFQLIRKTAGE
jgi:MoaA/NifB/PqqE/SkfB family radical SAM enzyme